MTTQQRKQNGRAFVFTGKRIRVIGKFDLTRTQLKDLITHAGGVVVSGVSKSTDPARTHASDGLGYCVLGAMKPLLGSKYKVRSSSSITVG